MTLHLTLWQHMIDLCESLNQDQYSFKSELLNGASIGEHLRHSYEFYVCLLKRENPTIINYDERKRDARIETDLAYAVEQMQSLKTHLKPIKNDVPLKLSSKEANAQMVSTSLERELVYCLDHAIHHQALIKIGLKELNLYHLVNENFGVAYSTIRFRMRN
ncbi:MAG: DinB family protein [Flavobacteriaceae bacterium]|nr:DinB family protein [Flavobacteriaceae bacterium]